MLTLTLSDLIQTRSGHPQIPSGRPLTHSGLPPTPSGRLLTPINHATSLTNRNLRPANICACYTTRHETEEPAVNYSLVLRVSTPPLIIHRTPGLLAPAGPMIFATIPKIRDAAIACRQARRRITAASRRQLQLSPTRFPRDTKIPVTTHTRQVLTSRPEVTSLRIVAAGPTSLVAQSWKIRAWAAHRGLS